MLAALSTIKKILPEYEVASRPTKVGQSGIAVCVKLQTFQSILDVTTSPHNNILAVRITTAAGGVRIILGYGPQENETPDDREGFFSVGWDNE